MRKKDYIFTQEHKNKLSQAQKLREKNPNIEQKRKQARHKICKNCNITFCSITPTGYRTPKYVCCSKECASLLMVSKRKEQDNYNRNEEAIKKAITTKKLKNPNYGKTKETKLKQSSIVIYDKEKYNHWAQSPEGKEYLKNKLKGRIFSVETKQKMSLSRTKLLQNNPSSVYSCANGKKRKDINNLYFRSNWEANYARILNNLGIEWEYEKCSFLLSNGSYYTPDFKIGKNKFVEVKGWMDKNSKNKINLFINEYPQYELEIINEQIYSAFRTLFKHKITNWEGK